VQNDYVVMTNNGNVVQAAGYTMGASVIGRHTHEVCAKNKTPNTLELGDKNIQVNAIAIGFTESEGVKANEGLGIGMARAPTLASRSIKRDMISGDRVGRLMYLASGAVTSWRVRDSMSTAARSMYTLTTRPGST